MQTAYGQNHVTKLNPHHFYYLFQRITETEMGGSYLRTKATQKFPGKDR